MAGNFVASSNSNGLVVERARAGSGARWVLVGLCSLGVHLVALSSFLVTEPPPPMEPARAGLSQHLPRGVERAARPALAQQKRRLLLEEARGERARGSLSLGHFLLRANQIDAEEEGVRVDLLRARDAYAARLTALRSALETAPLELAVTQVFADLAYTGTPGGRMIEALQEHRGSCEPVSHLLAATLFDLGHGERTRLRFYGGSAGAKHLTVILSGTGTKDSPVPWARKGAFGAACSEGTGESCSLIQLASQKKAPEELDLLSGQGPEPGGASFPADELVEAWARNHGLAPRTARLAASADTFVPNGVPDTRTLTAGYPENGDKFGGPLPLYADRAVSPVSPPGSPPRTVFDAPPCPFHVHVAWLDPPRAEAQAREHTSVVLHRQPSKAELERVATNIYAVESRKKSDLASRLMDQACLAAMHDNAATLFSLAGQPRVAERAASEAAAARQLGAQALSEWDALSVSEKGALAKRLDEQSLGRTWTLLFLQGGERVVLPLAEKESSSFVRTAALMALLVHPATRSRALALANQLPLSEQIDVMHELMHTHDHQRPWAASYFMDLAPAQATGPFPRMYRVFAALWWRLWDAQLPPERVIAALVSEAQAQHLERPALEAIATYYMKSFYRLVASRAGGPALVERAAKAAEAAGLPGKGVLSQEDLEGRVTKPTRTPK